MANVEPMPGICSWPLDQRPREKMLARGSAALSDAELLALFLRTGVASAPGLPRQSAVELGRRVLAHCGTLRAVLDADADALRGVRGIGPAKLCELQAIGELVRRALDQQLRSAAMLDSPAAVRDYLRLVIGNRSYEVFVTLYLDARHRLIKVEESSRGTLTRTAVYPREIARQALAANAAAVIVAHNHPSGVAEPSPADRQLTGHLKAVMDLLDIRLLDHFVVASNTVFSFAEHGWL